MATARVSLDCTGLATVAVLCHRDGWVEPLRFDGAAELPSGVYVADAGRLLTGRAALDAATTQPDRYIASPLHLLATAPAPGTGRADPTDIVAALLARVCEQATQAAGTPVTQAVVVVPPGWGPRRRTRLRQAAHRAGLTDIEMVDAAIALAHHHTGHPQPGENPVVLVCRLAGSDADATILRPTSGGGFETIATITDGDVPALSAATAEHIAAITTRALAAADLTGTEVTATVLHAPAPYLPGLAAGLRRLGITAATRTAADADTTLSALNLVTGQAPAAQGRLRQARHAVAAAVPLTGAAVLLGLLLRTGVPPNSDAAKRISDLTAPPYLLTHWPAWSMIAILVCLGTLAIVLYRADQRLQHATPDTEADRRDSLARGLGVTAAVTVAAGVVTAMLGATTYRTVPSWYLLLWAAGPALLLAGIATLIATLVRSGHTSALRWQIWLRLPNTTIVLAVAGLIAIHLGLYFTQYWYTLFPDLPLGLYARLPAGIGRLGTIALALAILPLLLRHLERQILASPLVIAVVLWTHSFTNTTLVIGAVLTATCLWWVTRIRPAAAYSDPDHPASVLAAELEPRPAANPTAPTVG